jgi:hypothetical protein
LKKVFAISHERLSGIVWLFAAAAALDRLSVGLSAAARQTRVSMAD